MLRLRQLLPKATSQALSAGDEEALPLPVLEFQSPTAAVIATPLPPIARSTTYILSALIAIMLIIAGTFKVDKLVVGTGTLNATTADSSIQVFNTSSIIREIKVHAGDFVAKGQVLATLDPTYATADLTGLTKQEQNYAGPGGPAPGAGGRQALRAGPKQPVCRAGTANLQPADGAV